MIAHSSYQFSFKVGLLCLVFTSLGSHVHFFHVHDCFSLFSFSTVPFSLTYTFYTSFFVLNKAEMEFRHMCLNLTTSSELLHFVTYFWGYKRWETTLDIKPCCHYVFQPCQCLLVWKPIPIRAALMLFVMIALTWAKVPLPAS